MLAIDLAQMKAIEKVILQVTRACLRKVTNVTVKIESRDKVLQEFGEDTDIPEGSGYSAITESLQIKDSGQLGTLHSSRYSGCYMHTIYVDTIPVASTP